MHQTKTITLPIGYIDPAKPDAPPARKLTVRLPTISDEIKADTVRAELARHQEQGVKDFARSDMATSVIFLANVICEWPGVDLFGWQHVRQLTRVDYSALNRAVAELEEEAVAAASKAEAKGKTTP